MEQNPLHSKDLTFGVPQAFLDILNDMVEGRVNSRPELHKSAETSPNKRKKGKMIPKSPTSIASFLGESAYLKANEIAIAPLLTSRFQRAQKFSFFGATDSSEEDNPFVQN
jgi:hypothetical protein